MPRYAAFLRGVSPMSAKMPELKRCLELAGFKDVKTLLSSGNVVFSSRAASLHVLERKLEQAMEKHLGQAFSPFVRPIGALHVLLASDPYKAFRLAANTKRIVTFLRAKPAVRIELPIEFEGARILSVRDREVFSAYIPSARGPVFMRLIEKTFGEDVTTRTWDTVSKVAATSTD